MLKRFCLALVFLSQPAYADSLPVAISCYQDRTNTKDIDACMACFVPDAEMVDVNRTINGAEAIRAWAEREVIPKGDTFRHRRILESDNNFARAEVNWLTWVVHYSCWWDDSGKITRMSLQYAD